VSGHGEARESTHTRIARAPRSRAAKALAGATVLRAGDLVLLCIEENVDAEQFDTMIGMLKAHAPDVTWGLIEGVKGVLVQRGPETEYYCTRQHECGAASMGPCNGYPQPRSQRGQRAE
jgi:hypothetical protein